MTASRNCPLLYNLLLKILIVSVCLTLLICDPNSVNAQNDNINSENKKINEKNEANDDADNVNGENNPNPDEKNTTDVPGPSDDNDDQNNNNEEDSDSDDFPGITTERIPEKCEAFVDLYDRYDCHPDNGPVESECLNRGCCWDPDASQATENSSENPTMDIPACYFPRDHNGYSIHRPRLLKVYEYRGTTRFALYRNTEVGSGFENDAMRIMGYITNYGDFVNVILHKMDPPLRAKLPKINKPEFLESVPLQRATLPLVYDLDDDAILTIRRANTSDRQGLLFRANMRHLIYSEHFHQLSWETASDKFFGLGIMFDGYSIDRRPNAKKKYTMFNYGVPPNGDRASYSTYPFYINYERPYEETGPKANGFYMHNTHPMDVIIKNKPSITWRNLGGILEFFIFAGPTPHDVVQQYTKLVGPPTVPPMWSLGFHLARNNYNSAHSMKLAWARTVGRNIPLDGIWTDIDFMDRHTSFTWNSPDAAEFIRNVGKTHHLNHMPIVNPGISAGEIPGTYPPYDKGKELDVFVKTEDGCSTLVGVSWPDSEQTVFMDFTNTRIVDYLVELLRDYEKLIDFSGLWLDMNEPEMFVDGSKEGCGSSLLDNPKYQPGNTHPNQRTLCMSAKLQDGLHYELHNVYAFYQSMAFVEALKRLRPNRRPFVVSRAQFSGQGSYSGSWLGDIQSSFSHMKWSIIAIIQSNWFAQPMTGGDICGYFSPANDELCARWSSLGAFYPLARNHNDANSPEQDPGSRSEFVAEAAAIALKKRYSLLPYLYTLFYQNHLHGLPVVRSIAFEFFNEIDPSLTFSSTGWSDTINDQFLWGPALLIAPVVQEDSIKRNIFLPPGRWFDISIGLTGDDNPRLVQLAKPIDVDRDQGSWIMDVETPLTAINLYLRAGHIMTTFSEPKTTVSDTIQQPFTLEVALDKMQEAIGELFWDSGESLMEKQSYNHIKYEVKNDLLTISMIKNSYEELAYFEGLIIYGLEKDLNLRIDGVSQDCDQILEKQMASCKFRTNIVVELEKPILIKLMN